MARGAGQRSPFNVPRLGGPYGRCYDQGMFWLILVIGVIAASLSVESDKRRAGQHGECGCVLCSLGEIVGIERADW